MTTTISHSDICALAKLTILVYEYGISITPIKQHSIETFVSDIVTGNINKLRK